MPRAGDTAALRIAGLDAGYCRHDVRNVVERHPLVQGGGWSVAELCEMNAPSAEDQTMRWLANELGTTELYVIDHAFTRLHPILDGEPIQITGEMLDRFGNGEPVRPDADRLLVPYLDGEYPILVSGHTTQLAPGLDKTTRSGFGAAFARALDRFERLEQIRRRESMNAAGQIQWDELPLRALRVDGVRAGATLAPAYDVAGDLFDLAIQPNGALAVVALDAMGHGVTSALSAVLALSAIRTSRREGAPVEEQMTAADRALADEYGGDRFVTGVALDLTPDRLVIVNAGHEPLRRYRPGGPVAFAVPAQPPLGVEGPAQYEPFEVDPLRPGDILVALSDGVSGATNGTGERYGHTAIDDLVAATTQAAPLATAHHLTRAIHRHSGNQLHDDVTAIVLKALPTT